MQIMKKIYLSGYVGWELVPSDVKRFLDEAAGEEIEIHLNTTGGSIYDGIAIYDLIDKYEGKKTMILGGIVASIGSYIATSCPVVVAQDISIFMVHNASNCVCGDAETMRNEAEALDKLNSHIADRLSRFTGVDKEAMLKLMDDESWYYGQEIVDAKFATKFLETGSVGNGDAGNAIAFAKHQYHEGLKRVAAFVGDPPKKPKEKVMTFKEFMEAANSFVESKELTLEGALALFGASDRLITDDQKARLSALDALGIKDPATEIAALKAESEAARKTVVDAMLESAFGKDDGKNLLRQRANELTLSGKTIDEIRKDPIAIALASGNADNGNPANVVGIVEPVKGGDGKGDKETTEVVRL